MPSQPTVRVRGHIDSLPDEIHVRFFDGCAHMRDLKRCALVSKRWFELVQEHRIFWSCAQLGLGHSLDLFLRQLNRRRGLPVEVKAYVYDPEWHVEALVAIVKNMHRITDLMLDTRDEERALQDLFERGPLLEKFALHGRLNRRDGPRLTPAPRYLLGGHTPRLKSVELDDATWAFNAQEGVVFPTVRNVSVKCSLAYSTPGYGGQDTPEWLIPPDALDRLATVFPGMVSLALCLSAARPTAIGQLFDQAPLHPFPAAPPSAQTRRVLSRLKALKTKGCVSGWSFIQHFPVAAIPNIDIRTEYQDTDVALACLPQGPFAVHVDALELDLPDNYEGVVRICTVPDPDPDADARQRQRTVVAPVEDCWSLSVLGTVLVSQVHHLCLLSLADGAFACLLHCGLDDLPALWALRVEFLSPGLGGVRLPAYPGGDEDAYPVYCPALRVFMFESGGPVKSILNTAWLESYLDMVDASREDVALALHGARLMDDTRDIAAATFKKLIVEDDIPEGESWMTRAYRLINVLE